MEPVDRIKARADALQQLGLDQTASSDDIRHAWRRIAFHDHPDHTDRDCSDFTRAKAAYDLLRKEGLATKGPAGSADNQPRRPKIRKRVIELGSGEIDACRAMLNTALSRPIDTGEDTDRQDCDRQSVASDHVPDAVGCFGRHLTYFVATPVCEGANRVALPTSVLASHRQVETEVLSFQSKDAGAGEVVVPETIMTRKFPGAKSVRIRFSVDQDMKDEFWLAG